MDKNSAHAPGDPATQGDLLHGRLFAPELPGGAGCQVTFSPRAIQVRAGEITAELPLARCTLALGGLQNAMLVIEHESHGGKLSLYLPRDEALAHLAALNVSEIRESVANLQQMHRGHSRRGTVLLAAFLVAILGLAAGAYLAIDHGLDWALQQVPRSWEVELGKQMVESMVPAGGAVENPTLQSGLEAILTRLVAATADDEGYEFHASVMESDQVNAFAAPGGRIVVTTALIQDCESAEELAGVLAHEVQHVLHRHGLHGIAQSMKWRVVLRVIFGDVDGLTGLFLDRGRGLLQLAHGRDAERAADSDGMSLMVAAHIDPQGMATFFERMAARDTGSSAVEALMQSHPAPVERLENLRALLIASGKVDSEPLPVVWEEFQAAAK